MPKVLKKQKVGSNGTAKPRKVDVGSSSSCQDVAHLAAPFKTARQSSVHHVVRHGEKWPELLTQFRSLTTSKQELEIQKVELLTKLKMVDSEIETCKGKLYPFQRCAVCEKVAKTAKRPAIPCVGCGIPMCAACTQSARCVEEESGRPPCEECQKCTLCERCNTLPGAYAESVCGLVYCTYSKDCSHGKDGNDECEQCKSFTLPGLPVARADSASR